MRPPERDSEYSRVCQFIYRTFEQDPEKTVSLEDIRQGTGIFGNNLSRILNLLTGKGLFIREGTQRKYRYRINPLKVDEVAKRL